MKATATLPIPPSLHGLWHRRGRALVSSPDYMAWQIAAREALAENRPGQFPGRVRVEITIEAGRMRDWNPARDIDNATKPIVDALVRAKWITDDNSRIVREVITRIIDAPERSQSVAVVAVECLEE